MAHAIHDVYILGRCKGLPSDSVTTTRPRAAASVHSIMSRAVVQLACLCVLVALLLGIWSMEGPNTAFRWCVW